MKYKIIINEISLINENLFKIHQVIIFMELFEKIYSATLKEEFIIDEGYLISFKPLEDKYSYASIITEWIGYKDKFEIRKASKVKCRNIKAHFNNLNIPLSVIHDRAELYSFFKIGGHAIVCETLMSKHWQYILDSKIVVDRDGTNYIELESIEPKFKQRFAKGELRMQIFNRDNYRCKICGSSENDSVHVRLEVHHIKPWSEGGLTFSDNLIALCSSCHLGASQINRDMLYNKIGLSFPKAEYEIYGENRLWNEIQNISARYLKSNSVILRAKNSSKPINLSK